MAEFYEKGIRVRKNQAKADYWYSKYESHKTQEQKTSSDDNKPVSQASDHNAAKVAQEQGCSDVAAECSDQQLCAISASGKGTARKWTTSDAKAIFVDEAKQRGLACGVLSSSEMQELAGEKTQNYEETQHSDAEVKSYQSSNAIQLLGITASMPASMQIQILRDRGYSCSTEQTLRNLYGGLSCEKDSATVSLGRGTMSFNCHNFKACKLSLREYAQALIDQGVVYNLQYEQVQQYAYDVWDEARQDYGQYYLDESYCGNGSEGDRLCLKTTGHPRWQIQLLAGGINLTVERGSGAVTFN